MVHGRDAQAFRLNDPEVWSPWFSVSNEVEQARRVRAAIRGDTDYDDGSGSDADAYGGSSVGNVARQRGGRAGRSGGLCALMLMRPLSAGSRLRGRGPHIPVVHRRRRVEMRRSEGFGARAAPPVHRAAIGLG